MLLVDQASLLDGLALDALAVEQDGVAAAEIDISRGQVAQALVAALVVVVLDESLDLRLKVAGQSVMGTWSRFLAPAPGTRCSCRAGGWPTLRTARGSRCRRATRRPGPCSAPTAPSGTGPPPGWRGGSGPATDAAASPAAPSPPCTAFGVTA